MSEPRCREVACSFSYRQGTHLVLVVKFLLIITPRIKLIVFRFARATKHSQRRRFLQTEETGASLPDFCSISVSSYLRIVMALLYLFVSTFFLSCIYRKSSNGSWPCTFLEAAFGLLQSYICPGQYAAPSSHEVFFTLYHASTIKDAKVLDL